VEEAVGVARDSVRSAQTRMSVLLGAAETRESALLEKN
jgi:hypothetical protein